VFETKTLHKEDGAFDRGDCGSLDGANFTVDPERRLVVVRFGKTLTADEIAHYARQLSACRDFEPTFSEIADLRDVEEINLQGPDFVKLADRVDPFSPDSKRAFLALTPTQSHAARMHKILRSKQNIEIFRLLSDAMDWVSS
jgi:hypothetical protein